MRTKISSQLAALQNRESEIFLLETSKVILRGTLSGQDRLVGQPPATFSFLPDQDQEIFSDPQVFSVLLAFKMSKISDGTSLGRC